MNASKLPVRVILKVKKGGEDDVWVNKKPPSNERP